MSRGGRSAAKLLSKEDCGEHRQAAGAVAQGKADTGVQLSEIVVQERPVYREFFAAGLTVFDPVEGFTSACGVRPARVTRAS